MLVEEKQGATIADTTSEQPSDPAIFAAQFFQQTKLIQTKIFYGHQF